MESPVFKMSRVSLAIVGTALIAASTAAQTDPLPSWKDGPSKQAILSFVAEVTKEGAPGFRFEMRPAGPVLVKEAKVSLIDDGPGKPVGINRHIGRRPILAFGNSDGDLQMLQWTAAGSGRRFMGIVHHTDAEREWAYDRTSHIGKLDKAWDEAVAKGWTVVDMKNEWSRIYPYDK